VKTLYLVRHAKSSWDDPSQEDFDRPLNKRGKQDAPFMGQKLKEMGIRPDLLVSSDAKRAKKTAEALAEALEYPLQGILFKREMYQADCDDMLKLINAMNDAADSMMIIGHNPEFTWLANKLAQMEIENIPTSGVVCIAFNVMSWAQISYGRGRMQFFDYPKRYQKV
jgi:phosphohistidine phosphatase